MPDLIVDNTSASDLPKKRVRKASIAQLVEPQAVTLVTSPANKTSFKIRRDTAALEGLVDLPAKRQRKQPEPVQPEPVQRADPSGLMEIHLPEGSDEDLANALLDKFDLAGAFEVVHRAVSGVHGETSIYVLRRISARSDVECVDITLSNGLTAYVDASTLSYRADNSGATADTAGKTGDPDKPDKPYPRLHSIEIDADTFADAQALTKWLDDHDVEHDPERELDPSSTLRFGDPHPYGMGVETVHFEICPGVRAMVSRADTLGVPTKIYREILPAFYGSGGYGFVDFAGALADGQFSSDSINAVMLLEDILREILFYQPTTPQEKSTLVARATSQFAAYITNLIGALPPVLNEVDLQQVQRAAQTQSTTDDDAQEASPAGESQAETGNGTGEQQTVSRDVESESGTAPADHEDEMMATEKTKGKNSDRTERTEVERTDEQENSSSTEMQGETKSGKEKAEPNYVTADELNDAVAGAVKGAFAQIFRSEDEEKEEVDPTVLALKAIADGQNENAKVLAKLVERMDKVQDEVDELGDVTVTRDDDQDQVNNRKKTVRTREDGSVEDVFTGSLGNLHGLISTADD